MPIFQVQSRFITHWFCDVGEQHVGARPRQSIAGWHLNGGAVQMTEATSSVRFRRKIVNRSRRVSGLAVSHRAVMRHAQLSAPLLTQPVKTLARRPGPLSACVGR